MAAVSMHAMAAVLSAGAAPRAELRSSFIVEKPAQVAAVGVRRRKSKLQEAGVQLQRHGDRRSRESKVSCSVAVVENAPKLSQPRNCSVLTGDEAVLCNLQPDADVVSAELRDSNIYLIGMMGCGKTTVGRILADALGYGFVDSDSLVEQTTGMSVADIFAQQGEAAFRDLETQAIAQLSSMGRLVVATGGGAVLRPANWEIMREGLVTWLDVPLEALASRVVAAGVNSRPILAENASGEDPYHAALKRLTSIWEKRKDLYLGAEIQVSLRDLASRINEDISGVSAPRIVNEIVHSLKDLLAARHSVCEVDNKEWCANEVVPDGLGSCVVPYGMEDKVGLEEVETTASRHMIMSS
jgi:shikimate kinase